MPRAKRRQQNRDRVYGVPTTIVAQPIIPTDPDEPSNGDQSKSAVSSRLSKSSGCGSSFGNCDPRNTSHAGRKGRDSTLRGGKVKMEETETSQKESESDGALDGQEGEDEEEVVEDWRDVLARRQQQYSVDNLYGAVSTVLSRPHVKRLPDSWLPATVDAGSNSGTEGYVGLNGTSDVDASSAAGTFTAQNEGGSIQASLTRRPRTKSF